MVVYSIFLPASEDVRALGQSPVGKANSLTRWNFQVKHKFWI